MASSVSRKKPTKNCSCCSLCCDVISRIPTIVLAFMLIFLWSSSTTIITSNIVHVCVSSRKLTSLYCLSASTQPNVQIPVSISNHTLVDGVNLVKEAVKTSFNQNIKLVTNKGVDYELEQAKQTAEEQMNLHRKWTAKDRQTGCGKGGIYVYDLPTKFNKDLIAQCGEMMTWMNLCSYFRNEAMGEPISELGNGWYNTHQYALEPIFHAKILKHPCRVYDEHQAKLFYVPYYGGLDILRWHFRNVSEDVKDSLGLDLMKLLASKETWRKNAGKDHVFVLGKISWDFRRYTDSSWGTRFLLLKEMQNPVRLLIERQPWEINDIGIPHPTYFHPHTDDEIAEWQLKVMAARRTNLVSFAGAGRPEQVKSIRSSLINQCNSTAERICKFLDCSFGGCDQPAPIIKLFMESEFCLQPPGDSPTRKSVFDSLVSGCIPVLFDPFTAYYQYPWHLPEDHSKYSIFIDQEDVRQGNVNVVDALKKVSAQQKETMRKFIVYEILPGLVYGDPSSQFEKFQDALSITVNNLLERASRQ